MLKVLSFVAMGLGLSSAAVVPKETAEQYRAERMAEIERINAMPNLPWVAGFNERWVCFFSLPFPSSLCGHPACIRSRFLCMAAFVSLDFRIFPQLFFLQHGQPLGASKSLAGAKADRKETMKAAIMAGKVYRAPKISAEEAAQIPASFDSAVNWPQCASMINNIRDQSNCGYVYP
jgi:hypothetical protein